MECDIEMLKQNAKPRLKLCYACVHMIKVVNYHDCAALLYHNDYAMSSPSTLSVLDVTTGQVTRLLGRGGGGKPGLLILCGRQSHNENRDWFCQ